MSERCTFARFTGASLLACQSVSIELFCRCVTPQSTNTRVGSFYIVNFLELCFPVRQGGRNPSVRNHPTCEVMQVSGANKMQLVHMKRKLGQNYLVARKHIELLFDKFVSCQVTHCGRNWPPFLKCPVKRPKSPPSTLWSTIQF